MTNSINPVLNQTLCKDGYSSSSSAQDNSPWQQFIQKVISGSKKRSTELSNKTPELKSKDIKLFEIAKKEEETVTNNKATQLEKINLLLANSLLQNKKVKTEETTKFEQEHSTDDIKQPQFSDWEADNSLPKGWKRKSAVYKRKTSKGEKTGTQYKYLSPTQQIFNSRSKVLAHIRQSQNYSEEEIVAVQRGKNRTHQGANIKSVKRKAVELEKIKKLENSNNNTEVFEKKIELEFECNYCPQQFCTSNEKLSHQQQEHAGEFRYKCNECGAENLKKTSLFYHVQSKHSDVVRSDQVTFDIVVPDKAQISNQSRNLVSQPKNVKPKENAQKETSKETNTQNDEELSTLENLGHLIAKVEMPRKNNDDILRGPTRKGANNKKNNNVSLESAKNAVIDGVSLVEASKMFDILPRTLFNNLKKCGLILPNGMIDKNKGKNAIIMSNQQRKLVSQPNSVKPIENAQKEKIKETDTQNDKEQATAENFYLSSSFRDLRDQIGQILQKL